MFLFIISQLQSTTVDIVIAQDIAQSPICCGWGGSQNYQEHI